jgi:hypothetical protein
MAQYHTFYSRHGENGALFYSLFVSTGKLCKRVGFPIHQMKNEKLVSLYLDYVDFSCYASRNKLSKVELENYMVRKHKYLNEVKQYHMQEDE